MTDKTFPAGRELRLTGVTDEIRVTCGSSREIRVVVDGPTEFTDAVHVDDNGYAVTVAQPRPRDGHVRVSGTNVIVTGDFNTSMVISAGRRVIVNGVDVTAAATGPRRDPGRVTIEAPAGTRIDTDDCANVTITGAAGILTGALNGQARLAADQIDGADLDMHGQSSAHIARGSTGNIRLDLSGQSKAVILGDCRDLDVAASGQSTVTARGSFGEVRGNASGMSGVRVAGARSRGRIRTSGMSTFMVDGG